MACLSPRIALSAKSTRKEKPLSPFITLPSIQERGPHLSTSRLLNHIAATFVYGLQDRQVPFLSPALLSVSSVGIIWNDVLIEFAERPYGSGPECDRFHSGQQRTVGATGQDFEGLMIFSWIRAVTAPCCLSTSQPRDKDAEWIQHSLIIQHCGNYCCLESLAMVYPDL